MTSPTGWILLTKEFYKEFVEEEADSQIDMLVKGHVNGIFPIEEARVLWNKLQVEKGHIFFDMEDYKLPIWKKRKQVLLMSLFGLY